MVAVVYIGDLVCMVCKCTAGCPVLLGYNYSARYRNWLLHPCFYHFSCAVKYITEITIKACGLSLYILIV